MSARTTCSVSVTDVTTAAVTDVDGLGRQVPLGFKLLVPQAIGNGTPTQDAGDQTWIYVENSTGAAWAAGTVVMRTDAATTYQCTIAVANIESAKVVGVSQHAVAAGSFSFVLREGMGEVLCDGNVAANQGIIVAANPGQATIVAADTDDAFGFATEVDAGAGSLVTALFNCLG